AVLRDDLEPGRADLGARRADDVAVDALDPRERHQPADGPVERPRRLLVEVPATGLFAAARREAEAAARAVVVVRRRRERLVAAHAEGPRPADARVVAAGDTEGVVRSDGDGLVRLDVGRRVVLDVGRLVVARVHEELLRP